MSNFFKYFPKVKYDPENRGDGKIAVNLMNRFHVKPASFSSGAIFYEYELQEGDRPDIIAHKFYGDANLAWIVIYFNNILDPIHDFPLNSESFEKFIIDKYDSVEAARSTVHHYEKIISAESYSSEGIYIPEKFINIDATTYAATATNVRRIIYVYDYEFQLNEDKRIIRLLDPAYIPQIMEELAKIF